MSSPGVDTKEDPIGVGVSSCLLGNEVRYDGGHKRDAFLVDTFDRHVEWVPVCPEIELGLGTPRPTLRLERRRDDVRLVMPQTGEDHTDAMRAYARRRVTQLTGDELCGYVLKKDSPSCGMERVRVYEAHGHATKSERGLFADALLRRFPNLPVEEEGRLSDPAVRQSFVERVCAYRRLRSFFTVHWTVGGLVAFHTAHKLQLMAHSPKVYERLGRLVAGAKSVPRAELRERYEAEFMRALSIVAARKRKSRRRFPMPKKPPQVGDVAPDFEALSDTGQKIKLSDYRKKRVVLYFYPKDNTPGCTAQACGFRDSYPAIEKRQAVVLGVSPDGVSSHQKFKTKQKLPFTLLVDEDHAIAEKYGVWGEKSMYGKKYMGIIRSHFIIDEKGKIVQARVKVSPTDSVKLALEALEQ